LFSQQKSDQHYKETSKMDTAIMLSESLDVTRTGVTAVVPDDDVARLMYYLHCVTCVTVDNTLEKDLVDYKNYRRLSHMRFVRVFKEALRLSPDKLIDKLIVLDDGGVFLGTSSNDFYEFSAARSFAVSLQREVVIAGEVQTVSKVMFFKSSWRDKYYTRPIARLRAQRCIHCQGMYRMCACDDGPQHHTPQPQVVQHSMPKPPVVQHPLPTTITMFQRFCRPVTFVLAAAFIISFLTSVSLPFLLCLDIARVYFNSPVQTPETLDHWQSRVRVSLPISLINTR
jgi:hypothetical protein